MRYTKSQQLPAKKQSRTYLNQKANRKLKELFAEKGIESCEICGSRTWLTWAHKYKRRHYYDKPDEELWNYKTTALLCLKHHMEIEGNKEKTKELFDQLRKDL